MGGRDSTFDSARAFSRNVGWITEDEARVLTAKRVAIAGMGGVGGHHLLTLARLGIGAFTIADFDVFEVENFNRQAGAMLSTVGREKARVMRPQFVLLDIGMPGMSGYDVAKRLREDEEFEGIVITALTGYGQAEDRRRSREAGFNHHLTKPPDPDQLAALLQSPGSFADHFASN